LSNQISQETPAVWVFAEQGDGALNDVSLELLGKAAQLSSELGGQTAALLFGDGVSELSVPLFEAGADVVYHADDPRLKDYLTLPYARVITDLVVRHAPGILLFGATPLGRDLAPRVASQLRCGLTADCTDLQIGSYTDPASGSTFKNLLLQIRPAFGGNIIATIVNPYTRPQMATVREGVMRMPERQGGRMGRLVKVDVDVQPEDECCRLVSREKAHHEVDLKGATIIVSGGAGLGARENFEMLFELADLLGGEVGASRGAVDAGFADRSRQVGQTGTTVRPRLYIACGISGAVQHRVGMAESGTIIAVNSDPGAPMFDIAHYGIVGDLNEVIPMFIKAYKRNVR